MPKLNFTSPFLVCLPFWRAACSAPSPTRNLQATVVAAVSETQRVATTDAQPSQVRTIQTLNVPGPCRYNRAILDDSGATPANMSVRMSASREQ